MKSNIEKFLPKETFEEVTVRKALYWISAYCKWELEQTSSEWKVSLYECDQEVSHTFDRLLNDYHLRYKASSETESLRRAIAKAVLKSISEKLKQ